MRWTLAVWLWCATATAQISPPGLGEGELATWLASGVRQQMDAQFESVTYVGMGELDEHPAILVVNEEVYAKLAEHWVASLALSYRHQFGIERRQEVRVYGRLSNVLSAGRLKLTTTFRPELRTFDESPSVEFRGRLREQLAIRLDDVQRVLGSAELLATQRGYTESRFCLYYSVHRELWPVVLNVGYMNDLIGRGSQLADVHYLAFDITWQNPFGKPHG